MKVRRGSRTRFTSVSIPTQLFRKAEKHIEKTGFPSVSSYVAFILRTVISEKKSASPDHEARMMKDRLRDLGYI